MPIVKSDIRDRFVVIPNEILRHKAMSPNAAALLCLMLSFPPDWRFRLSHLRQEHIEMSKAAMQTAFRELRDKGYAERAAMQGEDGKFSGYDYIIYDRPHRTRDCPAPAEPAAEKPAARQPAAGNLTPTNTEVTKDLENEETPKPLSAAPTSRPEPSSSSKEKITKGQVDQIVEVYNENCDVLPSVKAVNSARERRVRKIIREHGFDEAYDLIRRATLAVASDDFWRSKQKYGFDNLLAGDKYLQKAETWKDGGEVGKDLDVGTSVLFKMVVGTREERLEGVISSVEGKQFIVSPDGAGEDVRIPHSHVVRRL